MGELARVGVVMPKDKKETLQMMASQKGMGVSSMVRSWLYERMEQETGKSKSACSQD